MKHTSVNHLSFPKLLCPVKAKENPTLNDGQPSKELGFLLLFSSLFLFLFYNNSAVVLPL